MQIVVINSGSSSIKYQLIDMPSGDILCHGIIERIGQKSSRITYITKKDKVEEELEVPNHKVGLEKISTMLMDSKIGVISSTKEIQAVGHRVVHGGSDFTSTTEINEKVKDKIKQLFGLAPLHNPANLEGIIVAEEIFVNAKQIAVFDTAFHQTMPVLAYKYAIADKFLKENKIRAYGFHGTSHKYVSERAVSYLENKKLPSSKIISIHLGNGCSMTAIQDGKSIDTSLGFGTMNGLLMGTRSGDIDQSIIFHLVKNLGYTLDEVNDILQKKSGLLGLTGMTDMRDIETKALNGDQECLLATQISAYRIKKYIGSFVAALNGLDAIVFTGGIGENSDYMRKLVCSEMECFGITLDLVANQIRSKELREVNLKTSKVKILVVPTNEELEIASQAYNLLNK